ncbi:hypothetical protein cypCar_00009991 [Cyprinus carpio]|nr:hypothetical protein cypCar_00009991 [Cyprinus carpio]
MEFTCDLFAFCSSSVRATTMSDFKKPRVPRVLWYVIVVQIDCYIICECYFNLDFQNYLRTQTGSTTTINVIICTVDYLLRLQT